LEPARGLAQAFGRPASGSKNGAQSIPEEHSRYKERRTRASGESAGAFRKAIRSGSPGVPRSVAMSIVGQKTESIYRRYAIVDEAMQREAAARLDAFAAAPTLSPQTTSISSSKAGGNI